MFQFATPNGAASVGPASGASTPPDSQPRNGLGPGNFVERVHHIQDRSEVPQPKRRRVDDEEVQKGTKMAVRGGSGVLGQALNDQRQASGGNGAFTPQALTVDLTDGQADDSAGNKDPREEEVCYGQIKTSLNCAVIPSPKPGAFTQFGPNYQPMVKVVLKRQSDNRTNIISAYDHTREIIGQLDPACAQGLSPLLDSRIYLRTDSRLPPQPKRPGDIPGQPCSRAYSMDVTLYGPRKYAKNVGVWLSRHGIRLVSPNIVQAGIKLHNPHVAQYQPQPARSYAPQNSGGGAYSGLSSSTARTVEEVKSEINGVFDSLVKSEDLPLAEPHEMITTPLLRHQKQGLFFMQAREDLRHTNPDEKLLTSFWKVKTTAKEEKRYYNVITDQTVKEPPVETRGGILADMMGLGKTLSILALVASSGDAAHAWAETPPKQPSAPETKSTKNDAMLSQPSLNLTSLTMNAKTTLLVCPLSTIANWEEQIKAHVKEGGLTYHVYHGSNRIKNVARLAEFDLIITTYGSVSHELSDKNKGKPGSYPLEQLGWFRVVLDEAHMIREQATYIFKSIVRLQAQRRWAVTGTPVQNRLDDLGSLLAFLRLTPFDHRSKFNRYIMEPFKAGDPNVVTKLRILVDTVTLRRLKDKIDLPHREDKLVKLDFAPQERVLYDLFSRNAKDRVKALSNTGGKALGGSTYIHILKAILRLRLLCAHGKDLLNQEDLDAIQGSTADTAISLDDEEDEKPALTHRKALEMLALMQETNNDNCAGCSKKIGPGDPNSGGETDGNPNDVIGTMTSCFHIFCTECIKDYRDSVQLFNHQSATSGNCPTCKAHVRFGYAALTRKDFEVEHDGHPEEPAKPGKKTFEGYSGPHTKTKALVEDLLQNKAQSEINPDEPPYKSVVFSGWTSHLDLIEFALKAAGITFTRLDGSMSRKARTQAMDAFRDDNSVHVILVSIMAGGLGLNLTAGNNVYVMEPQFNPAAEAQAIDRVHRLGQKRPVKCIRYIMNNSFEGDMLKLQDKKKKLASLSMDRSKEKAAPKLLDELRDLFK